MTKVAIVGIAGRMGRSILENAAEMDGVEVVGGTESSGAPEVGEALDPGGVLVSDDYEEAFSGADVAIDFSAPTAAVEAAHAAARLGLGFVSGTTGLSEDQEGKVAAHGESIPVMRASNFSVGINLLLKLVGDASAATEGDFDIEVFEAHHRNKVDAPSGTALSLGESAAEARDWDLDEVAEWGRHGHTGERQDREIGFQVLRGGGIVGEHTVALCGPSERIELTHRAGDRAIFARGAITAASWIAGKSPGNYTMRDVLFG